MNGVEIDIFIPALNLGIEYDGIFFHSSDSSAKREENKNNYCKELGIRLIRVKETRENKNDEENVIYRKIGKNSTSLECIIQRILEIIATYGYSINEINVNLKRDDISIYNNYAKMEKKNSVALHILNF